MNINWRNSAKSFIQILFLIAGIILFAIAINWLAPNSSPLPGNAGYPPPGPTPYQLSGSTPYLLSGSTPYPPPGVNLPASIVTPVLRNAKDGHILSPTEVSAAETSSAKKIQVVNAASTAYKLNPITPTQATFPVASIDDLPQVIYHDPNFGSDDFDSCVQARNPGPAVLVHSLDKSPDYYIVPFFKNNNLCVTAMVTVENGSGYVWALGTTFGDKVPPISADEAIQQITAQTGKKVAQQPLLVFIGLLEDSDPGVPFWQVQTTDGSIYYAIPAVVQSEETGSIQINIIVLNANDAHPIN